MNSRQRAKKRHAEPVQAAWNVVAAHLVSLEAAGNCFFVDRDGYHKDYTRLRMHNTAGFLLVSSKPDLRGKK